MSFIPENASEVFYADLEKLFTLDSSILHTIEKFSTENAHFPSVDYLLEQHQIDKEYLENAFSILFYLYDFDKSDLDFDSFKKDIQKALELENDNYELIWKLISEPKDEYDIDLALERDIDSLKNLMIDFNANINITPVFQNTNQGNITREISKIIYTNLSFEVSQGKTSPAKKISVNISKNKLQELAVSIYKLNKQLDSIISNYDANNVRYKT